MTMQMICDAADKILHEWRRIASEMFTSAVDKSRIKRQDENLVYKKERIEELSYL